MRETDFDQNDHANNPGWATYHHPGNQYGGWRRLLCRLFGHPHVPIPEIHNGYSPDNYARCRRCRNWMKCYVVGQHRYGWLDR